MLAPNLCYGYTMKVTAKIQAEGNPAVDMVWSKDTDAIGAMVCVAQLLDQRKDQSPWNPELLAITIEL